VLVAVALAALTLHASRNGIWLLFFLAPVAARAISPRRTWAGLVVPGIALSVAGICVAVARGPIAHGASPTLVARAIALAHGSPVLASDGIEEQVALAGGRIWAGDPIDAFSRADQAAYLNFIAGSVDGRRALVPAVRVVVVGRGSAAARLMARTPGFVAAGGDAIAQIYAR
jgi:hypothetical protein